MSNSKSSVSKSLKSVSTFLTRAQDNGKKIVLATGVFDLLHDEHKAFFEAAAKQGDMFIVGVESDVRVKELKGPDRPKQAQGVRLAKVLACAPVSAAFILPEDFSTEEHHKELIALVRPAVLAVSEKTPFIEKKQTILAEFGGVVKVVRKHNPEVSTTQKIKEAETTQQDREVAKPKKKKEAVQPKK